MYLLLVSLCLVLSHFSDLFVMLFDFSAMLFVAKMTGKRRIGDFFDYTFGDETWVRARPGAMSMGTARFLREVFVRLWMVMVRPSRWDPVRYRRMYMLLYDRIQAGVMQSGERWRTIRTLHMVVSRVERMCSRGWNAGRVLRSHVKLRQDR